MIEEKTEEARPTGYLFMHDTPRICRCVYHPTKPVRLIEADVAIVGSSPISVDASRFEKEEPVVCTFSPIAPQLRFVNLFVGTQSLATDLDLDDFIECSDVILGGVGVYPGCDVTLELELENELKKGESVRVQPIYTVSPIR